MIEIRPDLQEAYDLLCYRGEQFPEPHSVTELEGVAFNHPEKGVVPIKIDTEVLALQGAIYVGDPALQAALREYEIDSGGSEEAANFLSQHLDPGNETLVWGFSGYATGGINPATGEPFGYESEARGLRELYGHLLEKEEVPGLAIDGGVSEGFLALNSLVAQSAGVSTMGFIPRQGLASVGVRDHLVVAGSTYRDRETLVGTADVLVCAGGAEGTMRECAYAVKRGAAALILDLASYPSTSFPKTFKTDEDLRQAFDDDRLVVCASYDTLGDSIDRILQVNVKDSRSLRSGIIGDFLSQA